MRVTLIVYINIVLVVSLDARVMMNIARGFWVNNCDLGDARHSAAGFTILHIARHV
jgi:hypothetical protein